jgi:hypothetical protein
LIAITLALVAACVAGFAFKNTRGIGIASLAALILINPIAFVALAVLGAGLLLLIHHR